jgi:hypothetical protein
VSAWIKLFPLFKVSLIVQAHDAAVRLEVSPLFPEMAFARRERSARRVALGLLQLNEPGGQP